MSGPPINLFCSFGAYTKNDRMLWLLPYRENNGRVWFVRLVLRELPINAFRSRDLQGPGLVTLWHSFQLRLDGAGNPLQWCTTPLWHVQLIQACFVHYKPISCILRLRNLFHFVFSSSIEGLKAVGETVVTKLMKNLVFGCPLSATACIGYALLQTRLQNCTPLKDIHSSCPQIVIGVNCSPFLGSKLFFDDLGHGELQWSAGTGVLCSKRSHWQGCVRYHHTASMLQVSFALDDICSVILIAVDIFCKIMKLTCFLVYPLRKFLVHIQWYSKQVRVVCGDEFFRLLGDVLIFRFLCSSQELGICLTETGFICLQLFVLHSSPYGCSIQNFQRNCLLKPSFLPFLKTELLIVCDGGEPGFFACQSIQLSDCCSKVFCSWLPGSLWGA